jgi:hypothetical protein
MREITARDGLEVQGALNLDRPGFPGILPAQIIFKDFAGSPETAGGSDEAWAILDNFQASIDMGLTRPNSELEINAEGGGSNRFTELGFEGEASDAISEGEVLGVLMNTDITASLPRSTCGVVPCSPNTVGSIRFFNPAFGTSEPAQFIFDGNIRVFTLPR